MRYQMEELVPIVAELAENYTSKESSSITYERAQHLMEAVLYSIHEGEMAQQYSLVQKDELTPRKMYSIGAKCVVAKTKEALKLYNNMMTHFSSYGNICLNDTVVKGLPEFFKWYDCKYEPQNTILTLDYPILIDISEDTGIDKIYDFIVCIQMEQKFLNQFSPAYVKKILVRYDNQYKHMVDNLCEIVLMNVAGHIVAGKTTSVLNFEPEDYLKMQSLLQKESLNDLRERLKNAITILVQDYYKDDERLREYLYKAVDNISVRMKCAAENRNLQRIF